MSCIELSLDQTIRSHLATQYDILLEQIYYVEVTTQLLVRAALRPFWRILSFLSICPRLNFSTRIVEPYADSIIKIEYIVQPVGLGG